MDIGIHAFDEIHNILDFGFFEYEASDGDVLGDLQEYVGLGLAVVRTHYGYDVPGPCVRYLDAEDVIYYMYSVLVHYVLLGVEDRGHHDQRKYHIEPVALLP